MCTKVETRRFDAIALGDSFQLGLRKGVKTEATEWRDEETGAKERISMSALVEIEVPIEWPK